MSTQTKTKNGSTKPMKIEHQQRMYDALKRIAKDYRSAEKIMSKPDFGLNPEECLEMAYENIQSEARVALSGLRRPKGEFL